MMLNKDMTTTAKLYRHLRRQGWTPAIARDLALAGGFSGNAEVSVALFELAARHAAR